MRTKKILCPNYCSDNVVKNGNASTGKPKHMCRDCRRQFVLNPKKQKNFAVKKGRC